jgi:hypothetical protein
MFRLLAQAIGCGQQTPETARIVPRLRDARARFASVYSRRNAASGFFETRAIHDAASAWIRTTRDLRSTAGHKCH